MLGNSPVSWKTKKQGMVSIPSAEAEYTAMTMTTSELVWIRSFWASLGVFHTQSIKLSCDNQAALHIVKISIFHECTEYIWVDHHFVREKLEANLLDFAYIRSQHQHVDIFTKTLGKKQLEHLRNKLGLYVGPFRTPYSHSRWCVKRELILNL